MATITGSIVPKVGVVAPCDGLATGEISAHFPQIYGASVSKETVSRITDKVLEEMASWQCRALESFYAAILIDAIVVKIRDGQVGNRPICAAIGVTLYGAEAGRRQGRDG